MYTETLTQRVALGNGIPPQTLNNGDVATDGIDMLKSRRALFILTLGNLTGGAVVNAYLQESSDNATWPANGTASPFSNSGGASTNITAITASTTEYTFEVNHSQLTSGKRYVRLQVHTTGGQNALVAAVAIGDEGQQKPNNKNNGANVTTQNVVS